MSSSLLFPQPAFFRCLSNSGTFMELRTTSFIETTGVACSDSVSHNRVQVLSIPVLLLACSEDWTCNLQMIVSLEAQGSVKVSAFDKHLKAGGHIGRNVVEITIKMKTIVRKTLMIKTHKGWYAIEQRNQTKPLPALCNITSILSRVGFRIQFSLLDQLPYKD